MRPLLIADKDRVERRQLIDFFKKTNYPVIEADSVVEVLRGILKKNPQVVLLGGELDCLPLVQVVPLLKKCSSDLVIILVSDRPSLPEMRKFRKEGIFYHALRPVDEAGREELLQAVSCAFEKTRQPVVSPTWRAGSLNPLSVHTQ